MLAAMEDMGRIERALVQAESQLDAGAGLEGSGFWPAVNRVKRNPALVESFGSRIAALDQRAFKNWALLVVPFWLGTLAAIVMTGVGSGLVALSYGSTGGEFLFLIGFGIILVTTHGLGHLVVGWLNGIRFTAWFIGTVARPQPGVKVEYQSYLKASPKGRAWMHASGALVSKLIPFLLVPAALAADLDSWVVVVLVVVGVGSIITDVVWSTSKSDWKKFRREMSLVD